MLGDPPGSTCPHGIRERGSARERVRRRRRRVHPAVAPGECGLDQPAEPGDSTIHGRPGTQMTARLRSVGTIRRRSRAVSLLSGSAAPERTIRNRCFSRSGLLAPLPLSVVAPIHSAGQEIKEFRLTRKPRHIHAAHDILRGDHTVVTGGSRGLVIDSRPSWFETTYTVEFSGVGKNHRGIITLIGLNKDDIR